MIDQKKINDAIDHLDRSGKRDLANEVRVLMVQKNEGAALREKLAACEKEEKLYQWLRESSSHICVVRVNYYSDEYLMNADELGGADLDKQTDEAIQQSKDSAQPDTGEK